ncbi:MAG: sigma-70 family RNA polymerase sigma factor, partial [Planctomycetes bacterium]|nr:sigma-70 family RNA polymerase sigma factor [Planctomycetota bacterium]
MDKTSLTLLERLRNSKDELAWQTLADIYTPLLRHWIRRYEVQAADADDLVQEVLTVAARELPNFSHSGRTGAFRAWLRTTLVHRVRDFWRNRQRRPVATGESNWVRQLDELEDPNSAISQLWQQQHDEHVLRHLLKSSQSRFAPTTWQALPNSTALAPGAVPTSGGESIDTNGLRGRRRLARGSHRQRSNLSMSTQARSWCARRSYP